MRIISSRVAFRGSFSSSELTWKRLWFMPAGVFVVVLGLLFTFDRAWGSAPILLSQEDCAVIMGSDLCLPGDVHCQCRLDGCGTGGCPEGITDDCDVKDVTTCWKVLLDYQERCGEDSTTQNMKCKKLEYIPIGCATIYEGPRDRFGECQIELCTIERTKCGAALDRCENYLEEEL